jgi:hypothetical protein
MIGEPPVDTPGSVRTWYSLACYVALVIVFDLAVCWTTGWFNALYCAWLPVGVAVLVHLEVEPGLPPSLGGNFRRILKAHLWPMYLWQLRNSDLLDWPRISMRAARWAVGLVSSSFMAAGIMCVGLFALWRASANLDPSHHPLAEACNASMQQLIAAADAAVRGTGARLFFLCFIMTVALRSGLHVALEPNLSRERITFARPEVSR